MIFNCCLAIGFYCGHIEALTQQFIDYYRLEKKSSPQKNQLKLLYREYYICSDLVAGLVLYHNFLKPWKEN